MTVYPGYPTVSQNDVDFETIDLEFDAESGRGTLVLDRPESLNALSNPMLDDLVDALEAFRGLDDESDRATVRAVTIEGAGDDAFCVGADLKQIVRGDEEFPGKTGAGHRTFDAIEAFDAPVVAKIDGHCLGGGLELAMACDFRIASDESTFGQPEIHLGIFPGAGATKRLPELVGRSRAKKLMMTGVTIDAETALDDRLVDAVHPAGELDDEVDEFVSELVTRAPLAVRAVKDVVDASRDLDGRAANYYAMEAYGALRTSEDHRRGLDAFFEDSEPTWTGT